MDDGQTFIFTENHRHLPIASVNDPLEIFSSNNTRPTTLISGM